MLFLGAGASQPFGVPTMKGFTKEILASFSEDRQRSKTLGEILDRLEGTGFTDPDIEAIMDVLTARQDPNKARLSIGPRIIEFAPDYPELPTNREARDLLQEIELKIQARCAKADYHQSDTYYQNLFDHAPGSIQQLGGQKIAMQFQHIFTTNYDLCIDSFLRRQEYSSGFEARAGHERAFTGNWNLGGPQYYLCKLHGSIDWWEIGGKVTQLTVTPGESLYREKIGGRMMVYPASEKYALRSPYAECLYYLRQQLRREGNCGIIGYSFRDTPINNAFIDALRVNPGLRLFSLGPHVSSRTRDLEEPLKSRIRPIDEEFGTSQAISALANGFSS
jgi:hypothetical protein